MQPGETSAKDAEISRIRARIGTLIQQHFNSGAGNLFLSRLGAELGSDRVELEKLTGTKLSQFIRSNFEYEIGVGGQKSNVLFLVRPGASPEAPQRLVPRYLARFWAAFAVPLADGEQRYIDLQSLRFGPDAATFGGAAESIRQIAAEYVAPRGASGSAADTAARIERWLEAQHLDAGHFLVRQKRSSEYRSVLEALLYALSGDELKRISMPLDVIKTLSERKI